MSENPSNASNEHDAHIETPEESGNPDLLAYLDLPDKKTWRPGAQGRELTEGALDKSWAVDNIIKEQCDNGKENF